MRPGCPEPFQLQCQTESDKTSSPHKTLLPHPFNFATKKLTGVHGGYQKSHDHLSKKNSSDMHSHSSRLVKYLPILRLLFQIVSNRMLAHFVLRYPSYIFHLIMLFILQTKPKHQTSNRLLNSTKTIVGSFQIHHIFLTSPLGHEKPIPGNPRG